MDWLGIFTLLTFTLGVCGKGTSSGKNFVTVFIQPSISGLISTREVVVTAPLSPAKVSVTLNKSRFKKQVTVGKGQTEVIPIVANSKLRETIDFTQAVKIESDADITVMSQNYGSGSGDMALIYPVDQLGEEYYIFTPPNGPKDQYKEFIIISTEDPTTVNIYPKSSITLKGKCYSKMDTITINLAPFETYQMQSTDDLSGIIVLADHKIAVIAGHTCAQNNIGCGHIYEQLRPRPSWGTSFLVPSLSFQSQYDTVFIMASQKTCITYQSGTVKNSVTKQVAAGDLIQINVTPSSPLSIQSTHGIEVFLHGRGGTYRGKPFGSFLTRIQDTNSFGLGYSLIAEEEFDTNLGIIIAKTSSAPEIKLDNKFLNGVKDIVWKKFPRSEYSWAEYNGSRGFKTHTIQHPTVPFGVLAIGFTLNLAYGSVAPCFKGYPARTDAVGELPDGQPMDTGLIGGMMQNQLNAAEEPLPQPAFQDEDDD